LPGTFAVCSPAGLIDENGARLLAAIDAPDDVRQVRVELDIPALSLARIDAFAEQLGLTRSALFVDAVDRWVVEQAARRAGAVEEGGLTLSDFAKPPELTVTTIAVAEEGQHPPPAGSADVTAHRAQEEAADITAELARLLEAQARVQATNAAMDNLVPHQSPPGRRP